MSNRKYLVLLILLSLFVPACSEGKRPRTPDPNYKDPVDPANMPGMGPKPGVEPKRK